MIKIDQIKIKWIPDEAGDVSYLEEFKDDPEHQEFWEIDRKRLEDYENGFWCMLGCVAEAVVSYPIAGDEQNRRLETFSSRGIWGIESDCDELTRQDFGREEIDDLKQHLQVFSVNLDNFNQLADKALAEARL